VAPGGIRVTGGWCVCQPDDPRENAPLGREVLAYNPHAARAH
jgi:hypothetical protein